MRHGARFAGLLACALAAALIPRDARAYENDCTHRELTRRSRDLLLAGSGGIYGQLVAYSAQIEEGADQEDEIRDLHTFTVNGIPLNRISGDGEIHR